MNTPELENTQAATPLPPQQVNASPHVQADAGETADSSSNAPASTLIEFPGANRNRPAWRKELSERVREIQQRRAREAALEAEEAARAEAETGRAAPPEDDAPLAPTRAATKAEERAKQLGLVPPPPEMPEMNPLVVAALKRIERARTPPAPRGRATRATHAATAAARVVEERYEPAPEAPPVATAKPPQRESLKAPAPSAEAAPQTRELETKPDAARLPNLVAVPPKQPAAEKRPEATASAAPTAKVSAEATTVITPQAAPVTASPTVTPSAAAATVTPTRAAEQVAQTVVEKVSAPAQDSAPTATAEDSDKPQPRRIAGVIDDHWLERHGADPLPKVVTAKELYDDRASVVRRCAAAVLDLVVVLLLSAPFAAVIELTIGNWGDVRVQASMGGVVLVMMFLYLTCSTALAGRTWGMSLFSLHTVDADSALAPTTGQCVRRTVVYMLSLATFGLGLLYALFDAEGRTAHDLLSRTVIVKE
jgi:uncharacterized RDD family membrane protein YckC